MHSHENRQARPYRSSRVTSCADERRTFRRAGVSRTGDNVKAVSAVITTFTDDGDLSLEYSFTAKDRTPGSGFDGQGRIIAERPGLDGKKEVYLTADALCVYAEGNRANVIGRITSGPARDFIDIEVLDVDKKKDADFGQASTGSWGDEEFFINNGGCRDFSPEVLIRPVTGTVEVTDGA